MSFPINKKMIIIKEIQLCLSNTVGKNEELHVRFRATEDVPIKGCGLCAAKVVSTTFSDSPSCSPGKGKKVAHLDGSKRALLGRTGTGIAGGCMLMLGI